MLHSLCLARCLQKSPELRQLVSGRETADSGRMQSPLAQTFAHCLVTRSLLADRDWCCRPCADDCPEGRDYSELCPQGVKLFHSVLVLSLMKCCIGGWTKAGGGFCEAGAAASTDCATSYDFAEASFKTCLGCSWWHAHCFLFADGFENQRGAWCDNS